jgi:hypothetical protein
MSIRLPSMVAQQTSVCFRQSSPASRRRAGGAEENEVRGREDFLKHECLSLISGFP